MSLLQWLSRETGLRTLFFAGSRDIYIVLISRFLRMYAYGAVALILAIFLWTAGNKGQEIGTFMSMTLLGDAAISFLLTLMADKVGRRKVLMIGSLLMTLAGTVFALSKSYWILLLAAIVGVISPGAHEVGPFRAVEESMLAQLSPIESRTDIYAWFAVVSTLGMAAGLASSGWLIYFLRANKDWKWSDGFPYVFAIYAAVGLFKAGLTLLLSEDCERDHSPDEEPSSPSSESTNLLRNGNLRRSSIAKVPATTARRLGAAMHTRISPESRKILIRLCLLFAVNSFASGMLPLTLMSWYANWRFRWFLYHRLGTVMAVVWLASSLSNLFSASVARRLGLVKAMVFTHLPTSIFLGFIPLASSWYGMMVLLVGNAAFGTMDQAPRSAFVAAVFLPQERTAVMGTINLVRTLAAAAGPFVSGFFWKHKLWWVIFVLAANIKVLYDIGLLVMFLKTKIPEHGRRPSEMRTAGTTVTDVDVGILLGENMLERADDRDSLEEVDDWDEEQGEGTNVQYEWSENSV